MTTKLMGEKVRRVEDARLLRGEGRYVDDLLPGALEVAVLRSPHAHARIVDSGVRSPVITAYIHTVHRQSRLHDAGPDSSLRVFLRVDAPP